MRPNRPSKAIFILALVLVLGHTGLAQAAEKVVLQLRWDHQFQFAGYYAALWQGYYTDAGINVEIRSAFAPDGKFRVVTREVADGRAHFGTGAADILKAREGGAPLVVLASIFQRSPVAFYAKAEIGLESPADLTRLRVATRGEQGIAGIELRAMLRAERIDPSAVPQVRIRERLGIHDLAKGYTDVAAGFTISADWVAKELDLKLTSIRPATYGVDFYGSALFTHRNLIEADPQMVQRFVSASLRGWEYALTHSEEIAERISTDLPRAVPIKDFKGFNAYQIDPVRQLTNFPLVELGHTNPNRWRKMHEALADAGLVTQAFDPADLIFDPEQAERQRRERLQNAIKYVLIFVLGAAIAGWIWSMRRNIRERERAVQALRDSRDRIRLITDNLPVAISYFDSEQRFRFVNRTLAAWYDRPPAEILGRTMAETVGQRAYDGIKSTLESALAGVDQSYEHVRAYPDGKIRTVDVTYVPHVEEDGTVRGCFTLSLDITEKRRAEEQTRKHTTELAQAMRLGTMGEMATALSHQLNQPLAAIYNFSRGGLRRLAKGGSSPDDLRSALKQISDQAQRASKIVRNIGDFVRRGEPEKKLTDVNDMVKTVANLAEAELAAGKIKLRCELADDLPTLMADAIEIEQVVLNLVRNGIEAMQEVPALQRRMDIRTIRRNDAIEIEVGDNGPGLPTESNRLFDPFFSTKPNGLGMGLAIGRTIVEAHGGRISAESNGECGALFRLYLPIEADQVTHG